MTSPSALLECHTLPQLPLTLTRLKFQPANRITQTFLLLSHLLQPSHFDLTQATSARTLGRRIRFRALRPCRRGSLGSSWTRQTTFLELGFGDQGLLATLEFVEIDFYAGEEGGDFGFDFGHEAILGVLEILFSYQLEVL